MPQDNTQPNPEEKEIVKQEDPETDQFDEAFKKASPVIQDYILGNKFEENIKLICKIAKLEGEKENTIIENVSVSILVGLLPLEKAPETLVESFKSSEILIDKNSAEKILKDIDTYILTDLRKQVLQSKASSVREIKHLTLKEENLEKEKAELRKILLERTGVLNGKGATLIQYKDRAVESLQKEAEQASGNAPVKSLKESVVNRDSLLAKVNLKDVIDSDKIKERMMQIKAEEDARLAKMEAEEKAKEELRQKRKELEEKRKAEIENFNKENENVLIEEKVQEEESQNLSKLLAKQLSEKLENKVDEETDLNTLREKRAKEEVEKQKNEAISYAKSISENSTTENVDKDFDPYREGV